MEDRMRMQPDAGEQQRREFFAANVDCVDKFVHAFRNIPDHFITDEAFMERFILEHIGLNNENLHEQPAELSPYYGTGLHIWQNPVQFSKFIVWLINNAKHCNTYFEIGCRWGGTFIVLCETLKRANPDFRLAIAADLIDPSPFIQRYIELSPITEVQVGYFHGSSISQEFAEVVAQYKPDITFIDGDHSCLGALKDYMLVRDCSDIVVFHDIWSDACPESSFLWDCLKKLETTKGNTEFIEQYQSVNGNFLGIGILYANRGA